MCLVDRESPLGAMKMVWSFIMTFAQHCECAACRCMHTLLSMSMVTLMLHIVFHESTKPNLCPQRADGFVCRKLVTTLEDKSSSYCYMHNAQHNARNWTGVCGKLCEKGGKGRKGRRRWQGVGEWFICSLQ